MCEKELETEQKCNILTLTLIAITAFLSRSPGLLNLGPGSQAFLGHGPHSNIFTSTATPQSVAWGPPLLGAGSLHSILIPTYSNFLCTELYHCFTPTQFNLSTVKVIPLKPVIYTGAFPILTARPGSTCNNSSSAVLLLHVCLFSVPRWIVRGLLTSRKSPLIYIYIYTLHYR